MAPLSSDLGPESGPPAFPKGIADRYRWSWDRLCKIARPVVAFEFWFSVLYAAALTPMAAWLLNRLVVSGDQLAISNYDLIGFVLSARGIAFLLLSLAFILALWYAEQVGLMIIALGACLDRKTSVSFALRENIVRLPELIRLGILQAACYGAACLPFAGGAALTYWLLLGDRDINYYLTFRPWNWYVALAVCGVLGAVCLFLVTWLFVRWIFAVPAVVFEKTTALGAMSTSWRRTRSRFWSMAIVLGSWWLAVFAASLATNGLIEIGATRLLNSAGLSLTLILPTVLCTFALVTTAGLAWLIGGKIGYSLMVVGFYLEEAEPQDRQGEADWVPPGLSPARLRMLGWAGAVIALLIAIGSGALLLESLNLVRPIAVTAHRGSSLKAPENTMSAIRQAIADGADYAEIDVQTTADGVVVMMHDADLARIASVARKLHKIDYDELKTIDIGSWFSPDFAEERIATLEEVIELARGRIKLNIELKYNRPDPELAGKVESIIRERGFIKECVITSLDHKALMGFRKSCPELRVGLIVFRSVGNPLRADVDFVSMNAGRVTSGLVKQAHKRNKGVHVWTVNDAHNALAMIEMGVDNIITDDPEGLRRLLQAWNDLTDTERIAVMLRRLIQGKNLPIPEDL
jgi:glycerophosphoryl diester phosphodiesterase